ncbi:MAG: hypothetical protein WBB39_04750 [Candidatus Saccharimonadales bacterium]
MPNLKKRSARAPIERDSTYFLKIVLYIILGSLWIKLASPVYIGTIIVGGFPLGLAIGLMFASHDHFQVDRKIEYALLIIVTIMTYFLPAGIVI